MAEKQITLSDGKTYLVFNENDLYNKRGIQGKELLDKLVKERKAKITNNGNLKITISKIFDYNKVAEVEKKIIHTNYGKVKTSTRAIITDRLSLVTNIINGKAEIAFEEEEQRREKIRNALQSLYENGIILKAEKGNVVINTQIKGFVPFLETLYANSIK